MTARVERVELDRILPLRALHLEEMNRQVRYNACHERGWSDSYLLLWDGAEVGYASVKGRNELTDRDAVFEYYMTPSHRRWAGRAFAAVLEASGPSYLEAQSNDPLMSSMLYECGSGIFADYILFEDGRTTDLPLGSGRFRPRRSDDPIGPDQGEYVLEYGGEVVAWGGFLLHYNPPFADLYMEVRADSRGKGYGALIVQEVKRAWHAAGRTPAARCRVSNQASRSTLLKAGMGVSGYMLTGDVKAR